MEATRLLPALLGIPGRHEVVLEVTWLILVLLAARLCRAGRGSSLVHFSCLLLGRLFVAGSMRLGVPLAAALLHARVRHPAALVALLSE